MKDICVNMIVRDEGQFLEPCLRQVIPYVSRVLIAVDNRSIDNTKEIVERLSKEFDNVFPEYFDVGESWAYDLPRVLNSLLKKTTEKWVWSLDGDEYYTNDNIERLIERLKEDVPGEDAYAFKFWYLIDKKHILCAKQGIGILERVFRNSPVLHWVGTFPGTHLHDDKQHLWYQKTERAKKFPEVEYVHFSLLKNKSWRKDAGLIHPIAEDDTRKLEVPDWVQKVVNKVYEN